MRRFERLTEKPAPFRELDIVGLEVRIRDGTAEVQSTAFDSERRALRFVDKQIAKWRAEGFVEIKRIAPAPYEDPVTREREVTWSEGALRHYRKVFQKDRFVTVESGHIFRDARERSERTEHAFHSIGEASALFDRTLAETRGQAGVRVERRGRRAAVGEVTRASSTTIAREPHLEAECRASPDARAPWEVYADWLMANGDVRGEIAGLSLRGRDRDARALLEASFGELWSEGGKLVFDLQHGFVRTVRIDIVGDADARAVIERVLTSPLCAFVDAVDVEAAWEARGNWTAALEAVLASPLQPQLRALGFACGDERAEEPCNLAASWDELANLERLCLDTSRGLCIWGQRPLPRMRALMRRASTAIAPLEVEALAALETPALDHLELENGEYGDEPLIPELAPLFAGRGKPALRHLGLLKWNLSPALVADLAGSRLLPQLDSIDFSSAYGEQLARSIADHAPAFRHLASLDFSYSQLNADEIDQIKRRLDNVITGPPLDEHFDAVDE